MRSVECKIKTEVTRFFYFCFDENKDKKIVYDSCCKSKQISRNKASVCTNLQR